MRWLVVALCLSLAPVASAKKAAPDYAAVFEQASTAAARHDVPEPESKEPLPWAPGQWVLARITEPSGAVSYRRTTIVEQADCGWWLEAVTTTGATGKILRVCYSVPAWPRPDTTEPIVRVIETVSGSGKPVVADLRTEEGAKMAARMGRQFKGAFQPLTYDDTTAPGTISVASGTFAGCRKVSIDATALGSSFAGAGWVHGSVPVWGMVKSDVGGTTTELVDFGLTGGASLLKK